jgi:hypothetical protein
MTLSIQAKFIHVETEKVPVARLAANIEKQIQEKPKDVSLRYALARLHSMAYALRSDQCDMDKRYNSPFFGYMNTDHPPEQVVTAGDARTEQEAKEQLQRAIGEYQKALDLDTNHLPSRLGLGWCLDQAGDKKTALDHYRKALALAWDLENKNGVGLGRSMTEEIAGYMLPLLDPKADAAEIAKIKGYQRTMAGKPRAVTPLVIPLQSDTPLEQLVDPNLGVLFDLDGSGLDRRWGWITPKAAWLVFDHDGRGEITSGLQLFGSVTFWVFWKNGYHALASLDDDGDGVLRGDELKGLTLWQDANGNGLSEPGELKPLAAWGITALSCRYETHATGIPFSPRGVVFQDGSTRPSYDWIAPGK